MLNCPKPNTWALTFIQLFWVWLLLIKRIYMKNEVIGLNLLNSSSQFGNRYFQVRIYWICRVNLNCFLLKMHIYFSSPFCFIVVDVMMFERVHEVMLNALFKYTQLAYEPCKIPKVFPFWNFVGENDESFACGCLKPKFKCINIDNCEFLVAQ